MVGKRVVGKPVVDRRVVGNPVVDRCAVRRRIVYNNFMNTFLVHFRSSYQVLPTNEMLRVYRKRAILSLVVL